MLRSSIDGVVEAADDKWLGLNGGVFWRRVAVFATRMTAGWCGCAGSMMMMMMMREKTFCVRLSCIDSTQRRNVLNIRSVYLSISAFTRQLHCIWPRCAYQLQQFSGDVVYGQQYAEIWRSHDVIWQDMDTGASTFLDHHCGTLCHWLFVIRHWL